MANELVCLLELLSSSSDDEEELNYCLTHLQDHELPKIKNFVSILGSASDKEFRKHFRLNKDTAKIVIEEYKNSIYYKNELTWARGTEKKTAETEVLLFLWFAANKTTLREVSQRFDTSISTAHNIVKKIMEFLVANATKYIKFPILEQEKEYAANKFVKISGFPSTIGCIDGTSIAIVTPPHKIKSTYVNRHDMPAITLQGICDYKKCFIDVFTGTPGKIHDARVLKLSHIYKMLPSVCGSSYHIVGDSAYPLREWLLTPYKDFGNLDQQQRHFNKTFSSTRVLIENTFGLLKNRFRQLLCVHMQSVDKITKFIISGCVLHNISMMNCDDLLDEEVCVHLNNAENTADIGLEDTEARLRALGEIKREYIKNKLYVL